MKKQQDNKQTQARTSRAKPKRKEAAPEIHFIVARGAFGAAADDSRLEKLMRQIAFAHSPDPAGEWAEKYGTNVETDAFTMHDYCWCEREECRYCTADAQGNSLPNFHFKPTDLKVWWYKYIGRSMRTNRELRRGELKQMRAACAASSSRVQNNGRHERAGGKGL